MNHMNEWNDWIAPIATIVLVVVLPYVVNLCKQEAWNANLKRWLAIGLSLLAGVATGLMAGMPTSETLVTWVLAVIGGVQVAYAAFKTVGVTSGWLDALAGIGSKDEEPEL